MDFLIDLHAGNLPGVKLHQALHQRHYLQLLSFAEAGYGKRFDKIGSRDELKLFEGFKRNLSQFAAAKQYTAKEELRRLRKLPLPDFLQEGEKYMKRSNGDWLKAEVQSTRAAALSASKWQEYQRRKYLYPNLRYSTVGDARVRDAHALLDDAVYPVDHPFWDTYMPPNGHRCRCTTLQTDQPLNQAKVGWKPDPGLRHNPGKTGVAFDDSHPYFNVDDRRRRSLNRNAEELRAEREWSRTKKTALERYGSADFKLPGRAEPVRINAEGLDLVRSGLRSGNTIDPAIAADLLTALNVVAPMLEAGAADTFLVELLGTEYTFSFTEGILTSIITR